MYRGDRRVDALDADSRELCCEIPFLQNMRLRARTALCLLPSLAQIQAASFILIGVRRVETTIGQFVTLQMGKSPCSLTVVTSFPPEVREYPRSS